MLLDEKNFIFILIENNHTCCCAIHRKSQCITVRAEWNRAFTFEILSRKFCTTNVTIVHLHIDYLLNLRKQIKFQISLLIIILAFMRSEEHTSELQSRDQIVCRLL